MIPRERQAWIERWMKSREGRTVDVLDSFFVDEYIEATNAKCAVMPFGADKCPQLGRDLGAMHKQGVLTRYATGLPSGDASMGFPKWVYTYTLKEQHHD